MKLGRNIIFLFCITLASCNLSASKEDHEAYFTKIIDSAQNLLDLKKQQQSYRYLDSAYNKFNGLGIGDIWRRYYFKQSNHFILARLNKDKKELNFAMIYADSMLNLIKNNKAEVKYKHEYSISNFLKGDVLLEMEKYEQSYEFFHKGKLLADQSNNTCDQADFNSRFAFLNYVQGKYRQAASLFFQAYKNNLDCKLDFEKFAAIQGALCNSGLSYRHIKMTDSALICFTKAIKFLESKEHLFPYKKPFVRVAKGVAYHYIGDVYLDSGNNAKAEEYLKKCIDLNGKVGSEKRNAQIAELKLARLYMNTGRFKDYQSMMDYARLSIDSLPNPITEVDWQKLRIDYLNLTKQYEKAKSYIPTYLKLAEILNIKQRKLNDVDARTEFYNLQKDYDLTLLKKENQLSNLYLIIAVGFFFMSTFIIYQIWRNWKISTKNNAELTILNKQIIEQNLLLQSAVSALEESEEENKRVMKIVAHDLRSPIGAIVSLADFMLKDEKLPKEEHHMINLIKSSGSDSLKFVNELLNKNATTNEIEKELVDLNSLLIYCINLLQYKADEKNQKIILNSAPVTFNLNREKIWRVISNLITNAFKFSPENTTITVDLKIMTDKVLISVKDEGIGIPDDIKNSIFNLSQSGRSGTAGEKSFGMGLVISKQIVEAHGGRLWLESFNNLGATFFIELPRL